MVTFADIDPTTLVSPTLTPHGRGAWTRVGIGTDYRYLMLDEPASRIGVDPGASLARWAVAAGCYAIQARLVALGLLSPVAAGERGIYGPRTKAAVMQFQAVNRDPDGGARLAVDGTVGRSDARALFTPLVKAAEQNYDIPNGYLVGETFHESAMDPGAVGYFIYYPDDRGVDRGMSQINAKSNPQVTWAQAFDPVFSLNWSALRLRSYFDQFAKAYPKQPASVIWDAAIISHNNPSAGRKYASGSAPTPAAAAYLAAVMAARF